MSVIKKYIWEATGLFLLLGLIVFSVAAFDRTENTAAELSDGLAETEQTVMEHEVMKYDGYEVIGSSAITYLKSVINKFEIPVEVTTEKGTFTYTDSSHYSDFRNITSNYYINPMKRYEVNVSRDVNDVISKVYIKQIP